MIRVTGGLFKGKKISSPSLKRLIRPTSSKVKEALFNILGDLQGCTFCDVFSGTGLVGIEALSRGSSHVTFIENNIKAYQQLRKNLDSFFIETRYFSLIKKDARDNLYENIRQTQFDIVFVDPPFKQNFKSLFDEMKSLVMVGGSLVIQYPSNQRPTWVERAQQIKMYGKSSLAFIRF